MFCCRILCFVLLLLSTAAAACACFFPLVERRETVSAVSGAPADASAATVDRTHTLRVYAWYTQQKSNSDFYEQVYTRDLICTRAQMMFMAAAVSIGVSIVFGVIGVFITSGSLSYREKRRCPCCSTFVVSLFGFVFLAVPIALTVTLFMTNSCQSLAGTSVATCAEAANCSYSRVSRFLLYEAVRKPPTTSEATLTQQFPSLKSLGFPIDGVGFCCLCGAAAGMLISMLLSICA